MYTQAHIRTQTKVLTHPNIIWVLILAHTKQYTESGAYAHTHTEGR